jgi:hypothetical protein
MNISNEVKRGFLNGWHNPVIILIFSGLIEKNHNNLVGQ